MSDPAIDLDLAIAEPIEAPTVTLGGPAVQLVEPPSLFALAAGRTQEQMEAGGFPETLAYGAACLRMCWPPKVTWPARVRPREWRVGVNIAQYGAEVWEDLRRGTKGRVPFAALREAVLDAHNYAIGSALTEAEVQEAVGFSRAQGGQREQ